MVNRTRTYGNLSYTQLLKPATLTADANSTGLDLQGADDATLLFVVGQSGDTLSGSVYLELEVEESDDNSTFTDVANADLTNYVTGTNTGTAAKIDAAAEDELTVAVGYKGSKRYIRGVVNVTGTHSNGIPVGIVGVKATNHGPANSYT